MNKFSERFCVLDPNEPGPFDICLRCFTPLSQDSTFCQTCGEIKAFLATPWEMSGERCFVHKSVSASTFCVLCGQPICDQCKEREGRAYGRPTPQCRSCVEKSRQLEADYIASIKRHGTCAKHKGRSAPFVCVSCSLPHCPECSYFLIGGFFKQKITAGPYCLPCFRLRTYTATIRPHWISGLTAKLNGLVK